MVTATGTHSEHDSAFRSLLRQLRTHAPFLQKIAINFPFDPSCLIPLSSFKSIHEVDVVGANISLLRALSVMESLTTLTIDLDVNQLNREDIVSPCYGFSSLQNLTMCGSLLCAMDILAAMSPPRLESLAMCTIRPVTVDQCRAFLELLPVRLPQLHEVNFEAPILQAFDIDVELERRIMELVEPLLDLQGLERVDIEVKPEFALSLSDGDFLAMGCNVMRWNISSDIMMWKQVYHIYYSSIKVISNNFFSNDAGGVLADPCTRVGAYVC
ncbi:hypothetical protein A0H81_14114 [Grifola frondosa]|uniref:Uncharacterized protein n=1 Tax=Grifola frondosa TaxID=5627 RepID=A0A1C7LMW5_GRIFR|nr:hypothetical protein A0H81_14114 [Grifola frondosa]